jgi:hypothetical protein
MPLSNLLLKDPNIFLGLSIILEIYFWLGIIGFIVFGIIAIIDMWKRKK